MIRAYRRLFGYLKPFWPLVALTWALSVLILFFEALSVWIGADFLERLLSGKSGPAVGGGIGMLNAAFNGISRRILGQATPFRSLLVGTAVLVAARLLIAAIRVGKLYVFTRIDEEIISRVRVKMFRHLAALDIGFSKRSNPGQLASLFLKDPDQLHFALVNTVDRLFQQPLRLAVSIVLLLSISGPLTLVVLLCMLLCGLLIHYCGNEIQKRWRTVVEKTAELQGALNEYLTGIFITKMLGKDRFEEERFENGSRALMRAEVRRIVLDVVAPQVVSAFLMLGLGVLLVLGGQRVLVAKSMPGADLLKIVFLVTIASYSVEALATVFNSLKGSGASVRRIFDFLDLPPAPESEGGIPFRSLRERIRFSGVSFGYDGDENQVFSDLSFDIPAGKITVIHGPTGSGKTTVLNLLAGIAPPCRGAVFLDGVDLKTIDLRSWKKRLGIVLQEPVLYNCSVRDNLLYANPQASEAELIAALERAQLWGERGSLLKDGLDTQVGSRGSALSGGERQRITIARALVNHAAVFLMDEPTSMLDEENKDNVIRAICELRKDRTVIIVSHDPVLRRVADCLFELKNGSITAGRRDQEKL
jgi:ABC-type multidrug transport system fused ATPase/permease subunit